jgi:hypothetical protein
MHEQVCEYYEKMLKTKDFPPLLEETYNRAKMMSDRLDGGEFDARQLAIIALVAGCDPFSQGAEPPRDMDFLPTPVPEEDGEGWQPGAPVEVDWNGSKNGTFVSIQKDGKIRVKLDKDQTIRAFRPSRVKMLETA